MDMYLKHHGIKDQKWGVRRFQNEDGTLTPAGKVRYGSLEKQNEFMDKRFGRENKQENTNSNNNSQKSNENKETSSKPNDNSQKSNENKNESSKSKNKTQMTNEELQQYITRNKLEKEYNRIQNENAPKPPDYSEIGRQAKQLTGDLSSMIKGPATVDVRTKTYGYLTDQEISDRIKRIKLENEYANLVGDVKKVKTGEEKLRETLQTIGSVVAIGSTVAGLIASINIARQSSPKVAGNVVAKVAKK